MPWFLRKVFVGTLMRSDIELHFAPKAKERQKDRQTERKNSQIGGKKMRTHPHPQKKKKSVFRHNNVLLKQMIRFSYFL